MWQLFAFQFELQPPQGRSSRDCLAAVRDEVAGWVCEVYHQLGIDGVAVPYDGTALVPHPAHELWSDQQECPTHRLATLEWTLPAGGDPTVCWQLCSTTAADGDLVQAALLLAAVSRPFVLRRVVLNLGMQAPLSSLPALVGRLLRAWPCRVGGQPVPLRARVLRANALDQFVRDNLLAPARALPVVLFNLTGPSAPTADGLQATQNELVGLAEVVGLANAPAAARLAELLGPRWACPGGGRLFWPGFTRDSAPAEHPHCRTEELLGRALLRRLVEINAARFREGELIRAARRALARDRLEWQRAAGRAEADRAAAVAEARRAAEDTTALRLEADAARQLARSLQAELAGVRAELASPRRASFDELAAELEKSWDENRRLAGEVASAREQIAELEADLRTHEENWALLGSPWKDEGRRMKDEQKSDAPSSSSFILHPSSFSSVADALRAAAEQFADVLEVWDDARRSAEASLFAMPGKVFRALEALAEVGRAYFRAREGGPPLGPVEQAFAQRVPFKYTAFESQTTLSVYGAERVFHHGTRSRQMQRHLTLGGGTTNNCLQVYFEFDDEARRVVVGHCGRHLPYHRQRT